VSEYLKIEVARPQRWMHHLAPAVPYIAVGVGVYIFHNAWAAILGYHLGMLLILYLSGAAVFLRSLFYCRDYKLPVFAAIAGSLGGVLLYFLWPLISTTIDLKSALLDININSSTWSVLIPYLIFINPWLEEWYWRGYLGSYSRKIILNDFLFAGYHLLILAGKIEFYWLIIVFVILLCSAWIWRQINRKNEGLLASTTSHLAADASILLAIYYISMNS
jgi:hypothetical protein